MLKDVSYTVMTELLQFMYQGVVNVKHTELNSFMKIAQALQIKGLATSSNQSQHYHHHHSHHSHHSLKSPSSPVPGGNNMPNSSKNSINNAPAAENYSTLDSKLFHSSPLMGHKRGADFGSGESSSYTKKHMKRTQMESADNDISTESMENISTDDVFPIPQISMVESSRFDLTNVKRENDSMTNPGAMRGLQPPFGFDYSSAYSKHIDYPNDLHMNNDLLKGSAGSCSTSGSSANVNHMDIPAGKHNLFFFNSAFILHNHFFSLYHRCE